MNFSERTINRRDLLWKSGDGLGGIALASLFSSERLDTAACDTLILQTAEFGLMPCSQGSTRCHVIQEILS